MADRWQVYGGSAAQPASGWSFDAVAGPSRLGGANGIVFDPVRGELLVTQVFGSQVTAIDVTSGEHRPFAPLGAGIAAPDDGVFGFDGTFFATEPMNATVSARNPDGTYRKLRDDLPSINGITMDRERRRLFADEFRPGGSLWELDPAGERAPRLLASDLFTPNALAMGPDGALWFPQVMSGEIWRYSLDDGSLRMVYSGLDAPCAVKFDSAGRIVTPESGSGRVTRIDIRTGARETLAELAPGIDNLALSPDDRLFVSHFTDGRVVEQTATGERVLSESGLVGPYGLALLADGTILVADGLSVALVAADGTITRTHTLIRDLPTLVAGAAVLGDGRPVVLGIRGQVFTAVAGEKPEEVAGHLAAPSAMCADGRGGLTVAEGGTGRVVAIAATGEVSEAATGFDRPAAMAMAGDGVLWVAERNAVVGIVDGQVRQRLDDLAGASGVAVRDGVVVAALPARREVVSVDLASGRRSVLVGNAPITSPVEGSELPFSTCPIVADGDSWLIGCIGEGSIRRLRKA